MSTGIKLSDLYKEFEYTKTQSGPVTPARTVSVKMMKGTMGPVKDQTSQKWDRRKYENENLELHKNYLTLKDIGIKIMTEATSSTSYRGMRINLSGIDFDNATMTGEFQESGKPFTFNLKYPTAKGEISVELVLGDGSGKSMLYDVALDSDQFTGNFSQSIRQNARSLVLQAQKDEQREMLDTGIGAITMPGNDFNDTFDLAAGDTNNITAYESVDWKMQKLLNICNSVAMMEAEGDFGPDDFAAPAGDMGGGDTAGAAPAPMDGTEHPQNAGDINGVQDGNGKGADDLEFREFVLPSDPKNGSGLSQSAWDNMAQIVADAINYISDNDSAGVKPSANEWYEGFPGVRNMTPDEILEQFLSLEDYKALDTTLPLKGLQQFAKALEGGKVDITKFKTDLGKWFPEVYNTDGTAMHDVAKETAGTMFPGDDNTGVGQGFDTAGSTDLNDVGGASFGGGIGDTADFMDNSASLFGPDMGNGNGDAGVDMAEDGSSSSEEGKDTTDLALDSLDNLF